MGSRGPRVHTRQVGGRLETGNGPPRRVWLASGLRAQMSREAPPQPTSPWQRGQLSPEGRGQTSLHKGLTR